MPDTDALAKRLTDTANALGETDEQYNAADYIPLFREAAAALSAARAEAIEACERVAQAELDADKAQVTPLRSNADFIKCGQVGAASRILAAIRALAAGQGGEK